jgi:hypothetical protein
MNHTPVVFIVIRVTAFREEVCTGPQPPRQIQNHRVQVMNPQADLTVATRRAASARHCSHQ